MLYFLLLVKYDMCHIYDNRASTAINTYARKIGELLKRGKRERDKNLFGIVIHETLAMVQR